MRTYRTDPTVCRRLCGIHLEGRSGSRRNNVIEKAENLILGGFILVVHCVTVPAASNATGHQW